MNGSLDGSVAQLDPLEELFPWDPEPMAGYDRRGPEHMAGYDQRGPEAMPGYAGGGALPKGERETRGYEPGDNRLRAHERTAYEPSLPRAASPGGGGRERERVPPGVVQAEAAGREEESRDLGESSTLDPNP